MAKCIRCGKSGIFLKVNAIGICKSCEYLYGKACQRQAYQRMNQNQNRYSDNNPSDKTLVSTPIRQEPSIQKIPSPISKQENVSDTSETRLAPINDIALKDDPDWYISLSFGKSSSASFPQAVALAKMAPKYLENSVEDKIIYQAIYSSTPKDYLNFVKLYELVSNWKSCFVIINGEMVDRKIVGQLNYCYGDCCRSGNPEFCYGASYMTENPFGCHRLQISACNHPWYTFGTLHNDGYFYIDKKAIEERAASYASIYYRCPKFNWQRIKEAIDNLPVRINRQEYFDMMDSDDDDIHITLQLK